MGTEAAVDLIFKAVLSLVIITILVWGFKKHLESLGKTPRAPCGYMTLKDLDQRCTGCLNGIQEKIDGVFDRVSDRLESGDKTFESYGERLGAIEISVASVGTMLEGIQTGLEDDRELLRGLLTKLKGD